MKIHRDQLPPEGKNLSGSEPPEIMDLQDPSIRFESPIEYSLFALPDADGLTVKGSLKTTVMLECGRCSQFFPFPIKITEFAVSKESTAECVDLTEEVREDILLGLPQIPKCELKKDGTCPYSRERWNSEHEKKLSALSEETLQPPPGQGVWDKLDELKTQKNRKKGQR